MADPTLAISSESVCFIIVKAREFDVQDGVTDPDSGSNASDDQMASVLETHDDDMTLGELRAFINALSEEEQTDLVALLWLGRGDGTAEDWQDLRDAKRNASTTAGRRPICWASPCCPITSRRGCRNSASRVRNSQSIVSDLSPLAI